MATDSPRMRREARTLTAMVRLYCRGHHGSQREELCPSCQQLLDYALQRLSKCPFQETKPTCANCPIHCYRPEEREQIRAVMRYAGPRMLLHHPLLAIMHLIDGLKRPEPRRKEDQRSQTM
ncbi:MAG: nitrous oxide-stimulated promoter family protein [Anaerolineae bacterium]